MRLLIKPHALFPVDAELVKGETAADESNLTGEAAPVDKTRGDTVLSGTMNLWGAVEVVVLRPAQESALQKIIRLIQTAQRRRRRRNGSPTSSAHVTPTRSSRSRWSCCWSGGSHSVTRRSLRLQGSPALSTTP